MARNSTKFTAIILAGGSGTRFWPLSTPQRPKQFLDVFGGESLLAKCVRRLSPVARPEDILVVTAQSLVAATRRELPELPPRNVIGEPCRRDTAAALALGLRHARGGMVGVFPADQLVDDNRAFARAVQTAAALAKGSGRIVTLGIKPDRPSTQFGYVNPRDGSFVEKPARAKATRMVKRGYLWNAGIFVATRETFAAAFREYAPQVAELLAKDAKVKDIYGSLPAISFDYAVMEKYPDVGVIACDCGWDDAGGYEALARRRPELVDAGGNLVVSDRVPVKTLGVANLVIAVSPDGVLVADRARLGELKRLFAQ